MKKWLELVVCFHDYWDFKTNEAITKGKKEKEISRKFAENRRLDFNRKCLENDIEPGQAWMIMLGDSFKWDKHAAFREYFS